MYKIGLESGKKIDRDLILKFIERVIDYTNPFNCKIYFKESLLQQAGIKREDLPENCVGRDYNMFNNKK